MRKVSLIGLAAWQSLLLLPLRMLARQRIAMLMEERQAGIGHVGIIELATMLGDFVQRDLDAEAGPVGSMGMHGFDHVGNGDDAGFQQDRIAPETVGVAAAVQALVMLLDNAGNRPGEIDGLEDLVAGLGMLLDEGELQFGEPPRLAEDFGRNPDLADVMDHAGQLDAFDLCLRQLQLPGERHGKLGDAPLVAGGATLGSLYYSEVVGYVPCTLCWGQRIFMYSLAVVLTVGAGDVTKTGPELLTRLGA